MGGAAQTMQRDNLFGAGLMCLAMALFAVEDAIFKSVTASLPTGLALTGFGLVGLIVFVLWSLLKGEAVWTRDYLRPTLLIRSGFEITGRLFFALSLALVPLTITTSILQATPLVVTAGAALFLREKVGIRRITAMCVGFVGVLIILRPTPDAFRLDALLVVVATLGFAGRDLATRASPPSLSSQQLGILGFAVLVVSGLIIGLFEGSPWRTPTSSEALRTLMTGLIGVGAYTALTRAMRTGEVAVVTPFRYTRLLVALIFAIAVFGEIPDAWTLLGASLIVASGFYTLMRSTK
ncbi:MAG: DMT family transporter [Pelagimonas sp.]|jgi:drug/metabolite transporter (DMT)-like permease|nr:DMT family transporter [Pelagimonas sp.]